MTDPTKTTSDPELEAAKLCGVAAALREEGRLSTADFVARGAAEIAHMAIEIERLRRDLIEARAEPPREALGVVEAARRMPRAVPGEGGSSTVHDFKIEAGVVWDLDYALKRYDTALRRRPLADAQEVTSA